MLITIDIPDLILAKAQTAANREGISLDGYIADAIRKNSMQIQDDGSPVKPWMAVLDELPAISEETTTEIGRRVAEADAADLRRSW